jgi:hypothetical protein
VSAIHVIRHLLEEPEDEPLGINPLEPYIGPVQFDQNVRDIIEYARSLKKEAEEANVMDMMRKFTDTRNGKPMFSEMDLDRAILTIAVEKYNEELVMPVRAAKVMRKHMHSIWD